MEGRGYVRRGRFVKICRKIDGAMSGVLVALLVLGYNTIQWKRSIIVDIAKGMDEVLNEKG